MIKKAGLEHDIEHRARSRDRKRIAAEGRAMRAWRHASRGIGCCEHSTNRKSAAERLGKRHHIGRDAEALVGKQLAGAAHAGLHLVEGEQKAVLVAEFAQRPEERWRRATYTAFALDRLDQDARGVRTDRLLHRLDVAMRDLVEAVHGRTEAIEIFGRAGRGE